MEQLSKRSLIASSSAWVAAILNIIPGIGIGYLYQRRWKAYWFCMIASVLCLLAINSNLILSDPLDPAFANTDSLAFWSLACISIVTSIESVMAVFSARKIAT